MEKTIIKESFERGQVVDTSDIMMPKEHYGNFWANLDDGDFTDKELEFHEPDVLDRCTQSYKLTMTITPIKKP